MPKAIGWFSNGLGNFILQMPAMQAVASMTDTKTIDVCLDDNWRDRRRKSVEDVCRTWPVIDRIINWPKDSLNDNTYDLWFYSAHGSSCDVVRKFLHNMKHRPVPKPSWRSSMIHEADHYMEIAYAMGYQGFVPKVKFPLAENPTLDLPRPIVGICNGWFRSQSREWAKKGWPHFRKLAESMRYYFGASVVGIGMADEIPNDVNMDIDYQGKLNILETAKAISQLDLFITTDTGPMHLANVLNIPLIAIFGPTLTTKNAPRGRNSSMLMSGEKCAPCQDAARFYHCKRYACMENIKVGDMMAQAKEKL